MLLTTPTHRKLLRLSFVYPYRIVAICCCCCFCRPLPSIKVDSLFLTWIGISRGYFVLFNGSVCAHRPSFVLKQRKKKKKNSIGRKEGKDTDGYSLISRTRTEAQELHLYNGQTEVGIPEQINTKINIRTRKKLRGKRENNILIRTTRG